MSLTSDLMELREADIRKHYDAALALLRGFDHAPRIAASEAAALPERSPGVARARGFRSTTPGLAARRTVQSRGVELLARIEAAGEEPGLVSPLMAQLQAGLRRALAVAMAVAEAYGERTALADLKRQNLAGSLPPARAAEFSELLTAEALISLHVFASVAAFRLAPHAPAEVVEIGDVEEVLTENGQLALHGCLWELDRDLGAFGSTESRAIATTLAFAEALMGRVATRAVHAGRLEPFSSAAWRVEADGLTIRGFEPAARGRAHALTMAFKAPHEVVGNHIAKHQALRLSKMLMAYDFERRLNPFAELGGFVFTFMGDGAPGTGKTSLIQMMAGLIAGYCETAGYPFRYANLSTDNIDSYQGKSGQNARAFIDEIVDPAVIGFGTIDDIDMLAGKRGDRQSSAGQLEITSVLMDAFAGANTVVRGNCTFGMFSNHPENVDGALRQRAGGRFLVDGPQTREDYIDILALLLGKNHAIPLGEHNLYAAQEITRAVAASYESHDRPKEERLLEVWERTGAALGPLDTLAKIGTYLKAIQEQDPRFTGRAIKNVTDAIKVRAMDFELPDEWMEEPDLFLRKDYATKSAMIAKLRRPITVEMVLQEINRYADSEFRYADRSDEDAIDRMVREMRLAEAARRRHAEGRE